MRRGTGDAAGERRPVTQEAGWLARARTDEHGIAHRWHDPSRVAVADVPLGSMSRHFADVDEPLTGAFTPFADTVASR